MNLPEKIYGLPKVKHVRKSKGQKYITKANMGGYIYYRIHMKRGGVQKAKYFKTKKDALIFRELLILNPYF